MMAALPLLLLSAAAAQQADVFVNGQEGYACFRIPAVLQLPNGHLAVYVEGRKYSCNDHDWNDIVFKTSADNGATWSPLRLMWSNSTAAEHVTIGNPSPIVSGGEVVMVFCRNNREVLVMRSPDGIVWGTEPVDITASALGRNWTTSGVNWVATGPPQGLVLPSGRILVQANFKGGAVGNANVGFAIISDDAGGTWRPSATSVMGCNEGQIAIAPNGSLLMNCRTAGYHRLLSYSDDSGESWSAPTTLYLGRAGSNSPCEGSLVRANQAALVFSHNYGAAGCARCNMTLWTSFDSGASWPAALAKAVDGANPATGGGYSALLALNATHTLLVYERSDEQRRTIALRTVRIPTAADAPTAKPVLDGTFGANCPPCREFGRLVLKKLYGQAGVADGVEFRMSSAIRSAGPLGKDDNWACPDEDVGCPFTRWLLCALDGWSATTTTQDQRVHFLSCWDEASGEPASKAKKCAAAVGGLNVTDIVTCHAGPKGDALQLAAARSFEQRFPTHAHGGIFDVPHIFIEGEEQAPSELTYDSVLRKLCDAGLKSSACADAALPGVHWRASGDARAPEPR